MTAFLIYIIKWAVALTALYSLYGIFLKKETFHALNRKMLLGILVASMALPFCHLTSSNNLSTMVQNIEQHISVEAAKWDEGAEIIGESPALLAQPATEAPSLWFLIPLTVYLLGVACFWARQFMAYASLFLLIRRGKRIDGSQLQTYTHSLASGVRLILNNQVLVPCSWMHWILVSQKDMEENGQMVIRHESEHIRLHHSWDMLLCDLTINMLWFLPFAHLLRKDLSDVHEYQADKAVIQSNVDQQKYHQLLIEKATVQQPTPIANSLNASEVKSRLAMMFRKESSKLARLKVFYVLPLLGIVLMAFARPHLVEEVQQVVAQEEKKTEAVIEEVIAPVLAHVQKTEQKAVGKEKEAAEQQPVAVVEEALPTELTDTIALASEQLLLEQQILAKEAERAQRAEKRRKDRQKGPVADDGLPIFYDLPISTRSDILYSGTWLERRDKECILHIVRTIEKDDELLYMAGEGSYIQDRDNRSVFYQCRGMNIARAFDTQFHVRGMRGKTVDFTLVFPPIPEDYQTLLLIGIGLDGNSTYGSRSSFYRSELEPQQKKK